MATLAAHHASARKIVLAVDQQLEQLETGRDTSLQLQSEISQHLNLLATVSRDHTAVDSGFARTSERISQHEDTVQDSTPRAP